MDTNNVHFVDFIYLEYIRLKGFKHLKFCTTHYSFKQTHALKNNNYAFCTLKVCFLNPNKQKKTN